MAEMTHTPGRKPLLLVLAGLMLVIVFSVPARYYHPDGHVTQPQVDTGFYLQYARAIAEGHPYRFIEGAPPSTGSTSHLYPFVLAVPCMLGARGDALVTAGFVLGAFCFLAFVVLLWLCARRLVAELAWPAALFAGVLNAHTLFTSLAVSDMALFMVLAYSVFAAALYHRWSLAALAMVLAVFCRPEGCILTASFFLVGVLSMLILPKHRTAARPLAMTGAIGLLAVAAMVGLNLALTGSAHFQSVASKGQLLQYPPMEVLYRTLKNLLGLFHEMFLGLAFNQRAFHMLPLVGGILAVVGIAGRRRVNVSATLVECAFFLTCLGSVVVLASNGESLNVQDRYFAWIMPFWMLYAMVGIGFFRRYLGRHHAFWKILAIGLLLFQGIALGFFLSLQARISASLQPQISYLKQLGRIVPQERAFMAYGIQGTIAYYTNRPTYNITGITTPELSFKAPAICSLEALKHRPDIRPAQWIFQHTRARTGWRSPFVGKHIDSSPSAFGDANRLSRFQTEWALLDYANQPLTTATQSITEGWELVDVLDIGYPVDERRVGYDRFSRFKGARIQPFLKAGPINNDTIIADVGRVIFGTESFTVRCPHPDQPLLIVLRTSLDANPELVFPRAGLYGNPIAFESPLRLRIFVDGRDLGLVERPVGHSRMAFDEIRIVVPAEAITRPEVDILIGGDHISYAYWFYQKPSRKVSP